MWPSNVPQSTTPSIAEPVIQKEAHFLADYPIPVRLLIATIRLCGADSTTAPVERCTLDTVGRLLDSGEQRASTIDSINRFCAIVLTQTRLALDIPCHPKEKMTGDEIALIKAASQIHTGNIDDAHMTLQWYMERSVRLEFIEVIQTLTAARCFKAFGAHVFVANKFTADVQLASGQTRHRSLVFTSDLSLSEQIILNTSRLWARGVSLGFSSESAAHCLCSHLVLAGFAPYIHLILYQTATQATREFDMRCLCSNEISPDEARLLATFSALFHGRPAEAITRLGEWLPEQSIQSVMTQTSYIKYALDKLGDAPPLRDWDYTELTHRQLLFDLKRNSSESVHLH